MSNNSVRIDDVSPEGDEIGTPKKRTADEIAKGLHGLGVNYAFGINGGNIAPVWEALEKSNEIEVLQFRHEGGAVFAACEYSIATGEPVAVVVTSGPGIANCTNALLTSRAEGARIVFVSPYSGPRVRGRFPCQETTIHALPSDLTHSHLIFDYSTIIDSSSQLQNAFNAMASKLLEQGPQILSLCLSTVVQRGEMEPLEIGVKRIIRAQTFSDRQVREIADLLAKNKFVIWLGFGARHAQKQIVALAEKVGAPVMCSPRAKGTFPESHGLYIGVTGLAGHSSVYQALEAYQPEYALVLGSKLGEFTTFWDDALVPAGGLIHVDHNPAVFGAAFPGHKTVGIVSDVGEFLNALHSQLPSRASNNSFSISYIEQEASWNAVHPQKLIEVVQRMVLDEGLAPVILDAGNSFGWGIHYLRLETPNLRLSTTVGTMGHGVCGVIGLGVKGKAVAIVGDGAMLMNGTELSTAVKYNIPAIWIVLNDSLYNMVLQVNSLQGMNHADHGLPQTDFAAFAESLGMQGLRVTHEHELENALETALEASGPVVIDVLIDAAVTAPIGKRADSLKKA